METLNAITILVVLTAVFSFANAKVLKLPTTIGMMLVALLFSLGIIGLNLIGIDGLKEKATHLLEVADFDTALLHGMLSFLLFAGALHINLDDLKQQKWVIIVLASVGVILSTAIVGIATYYLLNIFGVPITWQYAFVFGALISPTDPIAVLGILKQAAAPKTLATKIAGESLFNDGIAYVVFILLVTIASTDVELTPSYVAFFFLEEAIGGIIFGLLIGALAYWMLKNIDNYVVEINITIALVMGGYAAASAMHLSGPIAIVVAGLMIGNHGRTWAMSDTTRQHLDNFWEMIDEWLNGILFVFIGLELMVMAFSMDNLMAGLMMIPVVVMARLISVGTPVRVMAKVRAFSPGAIPILTWGGLRGGISVALALSLPPSEYRDTLITITYIIVCFSIVVQGLTVKALVGRYNQP